MTDLTPNDLSQMSDEDFNALCPQGHHAPGAEPLSPAAQAVLDAFTEDNSLHDWKVHIHHLDALAAALRAAADQVVPEDYDPPTKHDEFVRGMTAGKTLRNTDVRAALHQIAAELEGQ